MISWPSGCEGSSLKAGDQLVLYSNDAPVEPLISRLAAVSHSRASSPPPTPSSRIGEGSAIDSTLERGIRSKGRGVAGVTARWIVKRNR